MKYSLILFISLFTSLLVVDVVAQVISKSGIEVIGKASVQIQPDQFVFSVSINERGIIASKAKALVDLKSRLVVDKFLSLGIHKNAIESSRLQLIPRYEKKQRVPEFEIHQRVNGRASTGNSANNRKQTKVVMSSNNLTNTVINEESTIYFDVIRTITVTFTDFEIYDQLLDHAVKIGVTRISPLQTMIVDNEAFYQQALINALIKATTKAESIARQIGVELGGITHIKESPYHAPRAYMMQSDSRIGFNSQASKKNITAQVSVTFAIKKVNKSKIDRNIY